MTPEIAAAASVICLLLTASIYYCNILSRPQSWLRSEMLAMILLSLLVGLILLPLAGSVLVLIALVQAIPVAFHITDVALAALAVGGLVATVMVFRALVIATYRVERAPTGVTPLSPRLRPGPVAVPLRKAA